MSGDPIDLDAIEARLGGLRSIQLLFAGSALTVADGLALVAEVRRLREGVGALADEKPGATGRALRAILDP